MKNRCGKILSVGALVVAGLFGARAALATTLTLVPAAQPAIGMPYEVRVVLSSPDAEMNALEGEIAFPPDLLQVDAIKDGGSVVNLWIDPPQLRNGKITFSGITPGGFNGDNAFVFSVIFEAKAIGSGTIFLQNVHALANDGKGTELTVHGAPLVVNAVALPPGTVPPELLPADTSPPEPFTPEISSSKDLFGGAKFIVFATQDKGTGIDHYEVVESQNKHPAPSDWQPATSPYLLKDQKLKSYIFVRAVDRAGNIRTEEIARTPLSWYENAETQELLIALIVALLAIGLLTVFFLWWKNKKKA